MDAATKKPEPGTHSHQCAFCLKVWSHGDHMKGDEQAHRCPRCGEQNFTRTTEGYYGSR